MPEPDVQGLFDEFFRQARAFADRPDLAAGLELHEVAGRLKQIAISRLADPELGRLFHDMLRAIPQGDPARLAALLDRVGERLPAHGLRGG